MTYSQHRVDLKNICQDVLKQATDEIGVNDSVNSKLEKFYADGDESVLFRTFEEWIKMGYIINKGAKAFKFWGVPQEFEIRNPEDSSKVNGIGSWCPIIFKFSEHQVSNPQNVR
jgi:hypothetical protein